MTYGFGRWTALFAILVALAFAAGFQFSCASGGGNLGAAGETAGLEWNADGARIGKTGDSLNADGPRIGKTGGDYRAEIESLAVPDGVSPGAFETLKAELLRQLDERYGGDYSRAVSGAPQGEAGKVDDLVFYKDEFGVVYISWSYKNAGDYDLSGEVGVPDITPVALNTAKRWT